MTNGWAHANGENRSAVPYGSPGGEPLPTEAVGVVRTELTILNKLGLHARPAMQFSDIANQFAARITVYKDDQMVDAKSIMDMLTLAAGLGTKLILEAEGVDAGAAVAALTELVARKFDEE